MVFIRRECRSQKIELIPVRISKISDSATLYETSAYLLWRRYRGRMMSIAGRKVVTRQNTQIRLKPCIVEGCAGGGRVGTGSDNALNTAHDERGEATGDYLKVDVGVFV